MSDANAGSPQVGAGGGVMEPAPESVDVWMAEHRTLIPRALDETPELRSLVVYAMRIAYLAGKCDGIEEINAIHLRGAKEVAA